MRCVTDPSPLSTPELDSSLRRMKFITGSDSSDAAVSSDQRDAAAAASRIIHRPTATSSRPGTVAALQSVGGGTIAAYYSGYHC